MCGGIQATLAHVSVTGKRRNRTARLGHGSERRPRASHCARAWLFVQLATVGTVLHVRHFSGSTKCISATTSGAARSPWTDCSRAICHCPFCSLWRRASQIPPPSHRMHLTLFVCCVAPPKQAMCVTATPDTTELLRCADEMGCKFQVARECMHV
jgi:hypothetical protein